MSIKCDFCDSIVRADNIAKHVRLSHLDKTEEVTCKFCNKRFGTKNYLKNHYFHCNSNPNHSNNIKKRKTENYLDYAKEIKTKKLINNIERKDKLVGHYFRNITFTTDELQLELHNENTSFLFLEYMTNNIYIFETKLNLSLQNYPKYLFLLKVHVECLKIDEKEDGGITTTNVELISEPHYIFGNVHLRENIEKAIEECDAFLQEKIGGNSGLIFNQILYIVFDITIFTEQEKVVNIYDKNNIFYNSSSYIETPEFLKNKRGIWNPENVHDNLCLIYCCIRWFYDPVNPKTGKEYTRNNSRNPNLYKHLIPKFNTCGFDVSHLSEIQFKKIEEANNIAINVFQLKDNIEFLDKQNTKRNKKINYSYLHENNEIDEEDEEEKNEEEEKLDNNGEEEIDDSLLQFPVWDPFLYLPYRVSKYQPDYNDTERFYFSDSINKNNRKIILLFITFQFNSHFILILDPNAFFAKKTVCLNCMNFQCDSRYENKYNTHLELCSQSKTVKIKMLSEENNYLLFKEFHLLYKLHCFGVIDFETSSEEYLNDANNGLKTKRIKIFKANSYGFYFTGWKGRNPEYITEANPNEEDLVYSLLGKLKNVATELFHKLIEAADDKFKWDEDDPNTELNKFKHQNAIKCEACYKHFNIVNPEFNNGRDKKVIHHDHFSGEYLMTICQECNSKMANKKVLTILAHNLRGFDANIIIQKLCLYGFKVKVIPITNSKYLMIEASFPVGTGKYKYKKILNPETGKKENIVKRDIFGEPIIDDLTNEIQYEMEEIKLQMKIRFLDSFAFLPESLDSLIKTLKLKTSTSYYQDFEIEKKFKHTFDYLRNIKNYSTKQINLLLQKGIYPYSYVTEFDILFSSFPEKEEFKDILSHKKRSYDSVLNEIKDIFKWKVFYPYYNLEEGLSPLQKLELFNQIHKELEVTFLVNFVQFHLNANSELYFHLLEFYNNECSDTNPFIDDKTPILDLEKHYFEFIDYQIIKSCQTFELLQELLFDLEYEHASLVWDSFKCQNFLDYHNLYLMMDVLLLTDCIEDDRKFWYDTFKIETLYKFGLPGVSWSANLKSMYDEMERNNKIDFYNKIYDAPRLLTNIDHYKMAQRGKYGGICQVSCRYEEAVKPGHFLLYLDMNNLYGKAMGEKLPYGNYQTLNETYVNMWNVYLHSEQCKILNYDPESLYGYMLEIDVEIPENDYDLQDFFSDYPLFPELIKTEFEDLSPYQQSFNKKSTVPKILLTLKPKRNYVVNIRYLQLALKLGYRCTKIHKIVSYEQRAWLQHYMSVHNKIAETALNEVVRKKTKNAKNICYGKTTQNQENNKEVRLITDPNEAINVFKSPRYQGNYIKYSENLVLVELAQLEYTQKTPVLAATEILWESKRHMAEFLYDVKIKFEKIFPKKENNLFKICYTDTDSLIIKFEIPPDKNIYRDFILRDEIRKWFDLSAYPKEHEIFEFKTPEETIKLQKENKKIVGKMKDELGKYKMEKVICLKSKTYSYKKSNGDEEAKCKGATETPCFDLFYDALTKGTIVTVDNRSIRTDGKHQLHVYETIGKEVFGPFDDKRYIANSKSYDTLPFGHYLIKN